MEKSLEKPLIPNPHIVIIGAGASIQALPNGDKNGSKLTSTKELASIPIVKSTLESFGIREKISDFEKFFSRRL